MAGWDGQGLPPLAQARLDRARRGGVHTSLLSVPGAAGLAAAGFDAVGEVMGCTVQHLGWAGGGCGYGGFGGALAGYRGAPGAVTSGGGGARWAGFGPYVAALYQGWDTALARLLAEAQSLGADGVVGVQLRVEPVGQRQKEYLALGTAVRARSATRPRTPFLTHLGGTDVARLVGRGWVPVSMVLGISVGIRHDDWQTQQQAGRWQGNREVAGYTALVQDVRADARREFTERLARSGAEGGVVSAINLTVWEQEPSDGHRDHVAEATVAGTGLVAFTTRSPARPPLAVLPLRSTR